MSVQIHGKKYITVAERVAEAGKDFLTLNTEVLFQTPVVIKATVTTKKGMFTGISAANPSKAIEKMSPYEVAETSAVGRALGFAGYGAVEGIATADEMLKAQPEIIEKPVVTVDDFEDKHICPTHGVPMVSKVNTRTKQPYWSHDDTIDGKHIICFGRGWAK